MNDIEIWKTVGVFKGVDFTGIYEVSTFGRLRSLDRFVAVHRGEKESQCFKRKRILKLSPIKTGNRKGYVQIILHGPNGELVPAYVHRVVATVFIKNEHNLPEVNHKDENPSNNNVDNLEWCTREYNNNYLNHNKKVSEALSVSVVQLDYDGNLIKRWKSLIDVDSFGLQHSKVSNCLHSKRNVHANSVWMLASEYDKLSQDLVVEYCTNLDKRFVQLDKEGRLINIWISASEASRAIGGTASGICNCAKGKLKQYKGFVWMKYKDYKEQIGE